MQDEKRIRRLAGYSAAHILEDILKGKPPCGFLLGELSMAAALDPRIRYEELLEEVWELYRAARRE